jgi:hypothetical protein
MLKIITAWAKTINPSIVNHFKETAVHAGKYDGVRGRQRVLSLPPTFIHNLNFSKAMPTLTIKRIWHQNIH